MVNIKQVYINNKSNTDGKKQQWENCFVLWQHFIELLHVANRNRNTANLLLASAIAAIFTEMNSLDQEKLRSAWQFLR